MSFHDQVEPKSGAIFVRILAAFEVTGDIPTNARESHAHGIAALASDFESEEAPSWEVCNLVAELGFYLHSLRQEGCFLSVNAAELAHLTGDEVARRALLLCGFRPFLSQDDGVIWTDRPKGVPGRSVPVHFLGMVWDDEKLRAKKD